MLTEIKEDLERISKEMVDIDKTAGLQAVSTQEVKFALEEITETSQNLVDLTKKSSNKCLGSVHDEQYLKYNDHL
jgi:methyl-accepting chemotaxis protein